MKISKTKKDSIQRLKDQLVAAEAEGNTAAAKAIKMILKRLERK